MLHQITSAFSASVPPRIVYVTNATNYTVGDIILCEAIGTPPVNTQWIPASGALPRQGVNLSVTNDMTGNNTWTCVASNAFGNDSQQIAFIVSGLQINVLC
jgi:hypothetical protein